MTKDDFIEMTVNGGMIGEDRRTLLSLFNDEGECTDVDSFMHLCLMKLQLQSSLRIQKLNKLIADAINELGYIGQWTNLLQIHRSLPEEVKNCVEKDGEPFAKDMMTEWAKRQRKWDGLSATQQEAALKFTEEQELVKKKLDI